MSCRTAVCTVNASLALNLVGSCMLMVVLTSVEGAHRSRHDPREAGNPHSTKGVQVGTASYYGRGLHGKKRADGQLFDKNEMSARSSVTTADAPGTRYPTSR